MQLLSKELVSLEYRDQLRQDLAAAGVCRFLVAYVSGEGVNSIGRHLLTRALRDERSFGVASLSCTCGHEPLLRLQEELGETAGLRLKYFMDPLVHERGEPSDLALFHSKLVYLAQPRRGKSVVYIGSHNWTRRALGPGGPRNAEASLRLEEEFAEEHLAGTGSSLASEVNRHLIQAFSLPACLPATPAYRATFEQWRDKACRRAPPSSLNEVIVLLAIRKPSGTSLSSQWQALTGRGIYLQVLEEEEGITLWRRNDPVIVLVWDSEADLHAGNQPLLLRCRITTNKAGPGSRLHGTNQSTAPIAGFEAVLLDQNQLAAMHQEQAAPRAAVSIWSGRRVEVYDFEYPTQRLDSAQVDGGVTPKYQFHLEVESVVFPADGARPDAPERVWTRDTFAVAKSREDARYVEMPGYFVQPRERAAILTCLAEVLQVDPEHAKVLPISDYDQAKVGKRISAHPLHDTFLGEAAKQRLVDFYGKAERGTLVADLDEPATGPARGRRGASTADRVQRVQRVFTTPLEELERIWGETARQLPGDKRRDPRQ
jgi:hypothetical protein